MDTDFDGVANDIELFNKRKQTKGILTVIKK